MDIYYDDEFSNLFKLQNCIENKYSFNFYFSFVRRRIQNYNPAGFVKSKAHVI